MFLNTTKLHKPTLCLLALNHLDTFFGVVMYEGLAFHRRKVYVFYRLICTLKTTKLN